MRQLENREVLAIRPFIEMADLQAKSSPCKKSQRGAVVFLNNRLLGLGHNAPPEPLKCVPEVCQTICSKYAVHAEQNALIGALESGQGLTGATIFHIKVNQAGEKQPSNDLSCAECSRLVLRLGLREFILYQSSGFTAYSAFEFHRLTLDNLRRNL